MRIDGLTTEQCNMLDTMWAKDTHEELTDWFQTLPTKKYHMALTLFDIMLQEIIEPEVEKSKNIDAKKLLKKLGINCE